MRTLITILLFGLGLFPATPAWGQVDHNASGDTNAVQDDSTRTTRQATIANGIYLVQRWTIEREDLFPLFDDEIFLVYDETRFQELQDEETPPVRYLTLNAQQFIPFDLAGEPEVNQQQDGRKLVGLTFSPDMSERMEAFSRQYLGRQVATVVGGEILTLHKVRSVIKGGQIQISRCTDNGCELILSQLSGKR